MARRRRKRAEHSLELAITPVTDRYFNRELSIQEFHRRVLAQARDAAVPLLERLRFLCITSSILDEFFEVRVAGLKRQLQFAPGPAATAAGDVLVRIAEASHKLVADQYEVLNGDILPQLSRYGIRFVRRGEWSPEQDAWVRDYFHHQVLPILSPIRLDSAHPFPRVLNKALHFIVKVDGIDAFGHEGGMVVLQAPRALPRFVHIPSPTGEYDYALLSSIIHAHVGELFPGMDVTEFHQFRLTRDSDLIVDEDEMEDLRSAVEGELLTRGYGDEVRLEVAQTCPADIASFLLHEFGLEAVDLYRVDGPVNLVRLMALAELVDRPQLKYPPLLQSVPARVTTEPSMFDVISRGDLLLHHPFHSFTPVVDLVRQAAADPDVVAIKQTLYRTTSESPLEDALISAARRGKEVTAVVELLARFDEAANIEVARRLEAAGAKVVYGVVGYKTHAKMLMIVRREGGKLRRYVHLGTGNYNARTTRLYTDFGLLTADPEIGEDVHKMFLQLTSLGRVANLRRLFQAPFSLFDETVARIRAEAAAAREGRPARIIAKMNALVDAKVIDELYEASQAKVPIDLIVRGACSLRPGVRGLSETIRVRSVIDRFLEHSRVFYFENGGSPLVYLSSADWMARNFHRRIEALFPIDDAGVRQQVIAQGFEPYLAATAACWELTADGTYRRLEPAADADPLSAQQRLLAQLTSTPSWPVG